MGGTFQYGRWKNRAFQDTLLSDTNFSGLSKEDLLTVFEYVTKIHYTQR